MGKHACMLRLASFLGSLMTPRACRLVCSPSRRKRCPGMPEHLILQLVAIYEETALLVSEYTRCHRFLGNIDVLMTVHSLLCNDLADISKSRGANARSVFTEEWIVTELQEFLSSL